MKKIVAILILMISTSYGAQNDSLYVYKNNGDILLIDVKSGKIIKALGEMPDITWESGYYYSQDSAKYLALDKANIIDTKDVSQIIHNRKYNQLYLFSKVLGKALRIIDLNSWKILPEKPFKLDSLCVAMDETTSYYDVDTGEIDTLMDDFKPFLSPDEEMLYVGIGRGRMAAFKCSDHSLVSVAKLTEYFTLRNPVFPMMERCFTRMLPTRIRIPIYVSWAWTLPR